MKYIKAFVIVILFTATAVSQVRVNIYRLKGFAVGSRRSPSIYCNGIDVARLQTGRYMVLELMPGEYIIRTPEQSEIDLNITDNHQEYYIKMDQDWFLTLVLPGTGNR